MEHLIHRNHEPIIYSRKKKIKVNKSPHQYFFKSGSADINKNKEYSHFLHTYCDTDHAQDISDRRYFIPQQITSSILTPFIGAPVNNMKLPEAVPMKK